MPLDPRMLNTVVRISSHGDLLGTGSIISVVVSSVPGITTRTAQIVMTPPNWTVTVPADQIPREDR